ncbi:NAD(P)-binding domain-containing protein [Saccharopolyspora sp. NPDC002686]|uniref:ornithine cyclodeaminase family protein n=1 Tax=Saccharopolyspora sp. NPDC002686 TaxID=3154541 RepID=UPI00332A2D84
MREALREHAARRLAAPPRVRCPLDSLDYVFTAGGLAEGVSGFRAYRAGRPAGDQLVAVWDAHGILTGVVVGDELGARRTGALGAVAADVLARQDSRVAAIIGTGHQAWTQLWALRAVRPLREIRVYSRDPRRRDAFAARAATELSLPASSAACAADAVQGADIVVLATNAKAPVLDAADIAPGTHVTTVGPKTRDSHETPLELVGTCGLITCDSPEQARDYQGQFFTGSATLVSLADVIAGRVPGRSHDDEITLHCSVGLAGTEVLLADHLLRAHASRSQGLGEVVRR